MQGFRFLPHSVTSDVAFEAQGKTPEELFINAAWALFSVMADLTKVEPKTQTIIDLKTASLEDLLFNFLNELIFLKDRDEMLFSKFKITVDLNTGAHLTGDVWGEKIDPQKHRLGVDVKAVTKHEFKIGKEKNVYKATVVLDV